MSFVIADPEMVTAAAADLAGIRSTLGAAVEAAAGPTTGVAAAAADEVSAAIAHLFGAYGQEFQALNGRAAAFHAELVRLLNGGAASYLSAEVVNVEALLGQSLNGGAAAAADPLSGLLGSILGTSSGGSGSVGGILGGSGGLLDPILFGGTGGLLGPLVGGNGVLTSLVGSGPLGPFFNGVGGEIGVVTSALIGGDGAALLSDQIGGITGALTSLPGLSGLQTLLPGLFPSSGDTTTTPAPGGAWQQLFENTSSNLNALGTAWSEDPFPLLRQVIANQQGYAYTLGQDLSLAIQNLPTELAHLPENIETGIQGFLAFNPGLYAQQFVAGTMNDFHTIGTSLSEAGQDLQIGLAGFPADMQPAYEAFAAGNYNLAVNDATKALLNVFITGFDTSNLNDIRLLGPVADLFPILALPGQDVQGFSNLLPAGSIPAQMTHNLANVLNALTDTSISTTISGTLDPPALVLDANFGLPLSILFGVAGAPVAGLDGLATAGTTIGTGVATGNPFMVVGGLIDAPAVVLDGFLNGETIVDMSLPVTFDVPILGPLNIPVVIHLPFQGLLVPPHPITATVPLEILGVDIPINLTLGGTQFGGLVPTLVNYTSRHLANAITPAA
ncbi:PE family protein [Mycobacterium marinum]|uniref:PE family protein n=1 Tax=Mycobacterium marinum TaxID=1781 RepID=UPI0023404A0E|nr:PE family protein [Mycobacterium marinum]MDC8992934.1 PE family protein [Mycobacterium marinum]WDZ16199.1 PE family protein [Mycobacterium marinum]